MAAAEDEPLRCGNEEEGMQLLALLEQLLVPFVSAARFLIKKKKKKKAAAHVKLQRIRNSWAAPLPSRCEEFHQEPSCNCFYHPCQESVSISAWSQESVETILFLWPESPSLASQSFVVIFSFFADTFTLQSYPKGGFPSCEKKEWWENEGFVAAISAIIAFPSVLVFSSLLAALTIFLDLFICCCFHRALDIYTLTI